jgi:hypothetical protein
VIRRLLRWAEALHVYVLVLTLPVAAAWGAAPGQGGAALVVTHCLLVMLAFVGLDAHSRRSAHDPRLSLMTSRFRFADLDGGAAPVLLVGASAAAIAALALVATPMALYAAVAAGLLGLWALRPSRKPLDLVGVEVWWPLMSLLLPAAVVIVRGASHGTASGPSAWNGLTHLLDAIDSRLLGLSLLGCLGMSAWLMLCVTRDEARDRAQNVATSATALGGAASRGLAIGWMLATAVVAVLGVGHGWWSWQAGALIASAAGAVSAMTGAQRTRGAVGAWLVGHGAGLTLAWLL